VLVRRLEVEVEVEVEGQGRWLGKERR